MAHAGKWSEDRKALELAMCLTDDALNILLLLNPENRHDYKTLVGALRQRFGQFEQPKGVLCLALVVWREEQTTDTVGVASGLGEAFIKQK